MDRLILIAAVIGAVLLAGSATAGSGLDGRKLNYGTVSERAVQDGPPGDLADREPLDLPHPPDLRPAPHVEHPFLRASVKLDQARARATPDETTNPQAGAMSTGPRG
jgi:hypothetical protein